MNELIKIETSEKGVKTVDARELMNFLRARKTFQAGLRLKLRSTGLLKIQTMFCSPKKGSEQEEAEIIRLNTI